MRTVNNPNDFTQLLQCDGAILFIYVDWSAYAREGLQIVEEAEMSLNDGHPAGKPTFWLADVSDAGSPGYFIGEWLKQQNDRGIRMFPLIALGNGSMVWIKNGEVVDFAMSALHLTPQPIIWKTEAPFGSRDQA